MEFTVDDLTLPSSPTISQSSHELRVFKQGAEARLYRGLYFGKQCVVKERFRKRYRHPKLDEILTHERLRSEVRSMARCQALNVPTPSLYHVDTTTARITMEFIDGAVTVREFIIDIQSRYSQSEADSILLPLVERIGEIIAVIHQNNIIHGDLTTSNMLIRNSFEDSKLYLIDFGLSYVKHLPEDKGVDLFVLERAFISTHPHSEHLFERLMASYAKHFPKGSVAVLKKLDEVRQRGRKRVMIG